MNVGTRIRQLISRGASINMSRRSQLKVNELDTITATDTSFTSPGTIGSAGSRFGRIGAGSVITVIGSPLNSRDYVVATASASSVTVLPALLTTESAGATIQVYEG